MFAELVGNEKVYGQTNGQTDGHQTKADLHNINANILVKIH